ncbi:Na/Pi symporter [Cocleimonas flava]|uniref:Sodium-dependent phosphate cotransporter n=1 Tax=Cocleimonas flava TaxID=634765 RepID=A0A4R1ESK8_9GAMM|nr:MULTISPECIES: Na/Pi symporter [Cocleimonas]MEB8433203.1 Na/Pi symporter [Cocleimonas sp. KMM 6892]MEC4715816.1 Na/Pi symporter [Cocleimonas sp. KMM 6895]MEC4745277.1 Na/Pi symporter [Cocleimonas sp. KMM 6896]TCJ82669.1 sodium-dependent phosphate cotransporter [Cocleimonas flava]
MSNLNTSELSTSEETKSHLLQWAMVAFLVYLLICAVGMIGGGFKLATGDHAKELFAFASNPFAGLVIGTVATALIQSSSTVTAIIVGLVAGGLPVAVAVPMVMGANIGTSITNTIVSLGHVRAKEEFKRAFAAATVHDFFNLFSVVIFLPLEIMFGFLEKIGSWLSSFFYGAGDTSMGGFNFVKAATAPVVKTAKGAVEGFGDQIGGIALIVFGIALIFLSITLVGRLLKKLMVGKAKDIMHTAIGRGPISGIFSGTLVTVLVQSSSTTTSLMVPLAGSGAFNLRQIYPFTLGANIGTCVTAVLAATAVTGNAEAALQIAFIHLTYNILGVVIIYGLPFLRYLPVRAAEWLGATAAENKMVALGYILGVFFVIPGACLGISSII